MASPDVECSISETPEIRASHMSLKLSEVQDVIQAGKPKPSKIIKLDKSKIKLISTNKEQENE